MITDKQREALGKIWFVYGNNGRKHTNQNHGFIQGFLECNEDRRKFYLESFDAVRERGIYTEQQLKKVFITQECIDAVDKILNDEPQGNSPLADGAGLPGLSEGEVQSDSEVQQGDDGQGSGPAGSERSAFDAGILWDDKNSFERTHWSK